MTKYLIEKFLFYEKENPSSILEDNAEYGVGLCHLLSVMEDGEEF